MYLSTYQTYDYIVIFFLFFALDDCMLHIKPQVKDWNPQWYYLNILFMQVYTCIASREKLYTNWV